MAFQMIFKETFVMTFQVSVSMISISNISKDILNDISNAI